MMKAYPFLILINGEYAQSQGINLASLTREGLLGLINVNLLASYMINIHTRAKTVVALTIPTVPIITIPVITIPSPVLNISFSGNL